MTKKKLEKEFENVAQNILCIKTLKFRKVDGLDIFKNEEASISVGNIKKAFESIYELGIKEGRKESNKVTKINLAYNLGIVEVGKKVSIYNKEYTLVGIDGNYFVFACLKPQNLDDAMTISLTEEEMKDFIASGDMKYYKGGKK